MGNSSSRAEKVEEVPGSETDPAVEEAFSVSVDPALAQDRQQLPRATAVPVVNQQPGPVAGPGGAGACLNCCVFFRRAFLLGVFNVCWI